MVIVRGIDEWLVNEMLFHITACGDTIHGTKRKKAIAVQLIDEWFDELKERAARSSDGIIKA